MAFVPSNKKRYAMDYTTTFGYRVNNNWCDCEDEGVSRSSADFALLCWLVVVAALAVCVRSFLAVVRDLFFARRDIFSDSRNLESPLLSDR